MTPDETRHCRGRHKAAQSCSGEVEEERIPLISFRVPCEESRILAQVLLPQVLVDFLVADIKWVDVGAVRSLPRQLDLSASPKRLYIKSLFTVQGCQVCVCVCVCVCVRACVRACMHVREAERNGWLNVA